MFDQAVGCAFLVEDSDHDIAIFEYAARRMQFPITLRTHRTGNSAMAEINAFDTMDASQLPALFVLDIALPDVDGATICKRIRETYAARGATEPNIVFLTTQPTLTVLNLARQSSHIEVHHKPIRLSDYQIIFQAMYNLVVHKPVHEAEHMPLAIAVG